jgi:histone acetyltransferase 1
LKQHLEINSTSQLESTTTPPDDIEAKLFSFIPPDYTKSQSAFNKLVEDDAISFQPLGEKLGSYVRRAASAKGKGKKGKGKAKSNGGGVKDSEEIKEDDEDAVVFEMYKVSIIPSLRIMELNRAQGDMGYTRV